MIEILNAYVFFGLGILIGIALLFSFVYLAASFLELINNRKKGRNE